MSAHFGASFSWGLMIVRALFLRKRVDRVQKRETSATTMSAKQM